MHLPRLLARMDDMNDIITEELTDEEIQRRLLGMAPPESEEEVPLHPWDLIDLASLPDDPPPVPELLRRTDQRGLFYDGCINLLFAPQESSKTFLGLLACLQVLNEGGSVLYVDFESTARKIAYRLRLMGADLSRFGYIRPTLPLDEEKYFTAIEKLQPRLMVVDACAEAMVTHLLDESSNADYMKFSRLMLEPVEALGIGVVLLDHQGNDHSLKRPRGASSKLAAVHGSAIRVEVEIPFRRGQSDGRALLFVEKDREGGVREYGTSDGLVGIVGMRTHHGRLYVHVDPPASPPPQPQTPPLRQPYEQQVIS